MTMSPNAFTKDSMAEHVAAGRLVVGPHSYGAVTLRYWGSPGGYICRIGDYCSIADNVHVFMGGYHRPEWISTYPFPAFAPYRNTPHGRDHTVGRGDIEIGSDVWLSSGCTIMSGVKIGHGAVVAARAVVTRDVAPYAIVAGNPAREVKRRFDDDTIAELLAIAWWDWSEERIYANLDLLLSDDMADFIARCHADPSAS